MRKQEQKRKGWKGSYTVETSLIMGILIPVLFGILWLAILLYERGILQGDASEGCLLYTSRLLTMKATMNYLGANCKMISV